MNALANTAETLGYRISAAAGTAYSETAAASDVRHGAIDLVGMAYFNHAASANGQDNPARLLAPARELYRAMDAAVELAASRYEELVALRERLGELIDEVEEQK